LATEELPPEHFLAETSNGDGIRRLYDSVEYHWPDAL
jgi:hypothetical protein